MIDAICKLNNLPMPVHEYKFHPTRKWRLDYAWPSYKLGIEIEGGAWIRGRHNRASGFIKDMEKYNVLAELGWRLFRFTPQDQGNAERILKRFFREKGVVK